MTFQRDGSVKIMCPMRCVEETVLNKDQTVGHLATSYTIKSMLDTLQEDTKGGRENSITTAAKSGCRVTENCMQHSTVYCCGMVMCERCHKLHLSAATNNNNKNDNNKNNNNNNNTTAHQTKFLSYNSRENKLRVLCAEHASGCTHVCTADDEFLCTYCLKRNATHQCHSKNTVEVEANLLREAVVAEVSRSQTINDALRGTVQRVSEAKQSLLNVLRRRKKECMLNYKAVLDGEITRLLMEFDTLVDEQMAQCRGGVAKDEKFLVDLTQKLDVEMVLMKREILETIGKQMSRVSLKSLEISLTEGSLLTDQPLGHISSNTYEVNNINNLFFSCDWVENPDKMESVALENDASDLLKCAGSAVEVPHESSSPVNDDTSVETSCCPFEVLDEVDESCCGATNPMINANRSIANDSCANDTAVSLISTLDSEIISTEASVLENATFSLPSDTCAPLPSTKSSDEYKLQGNRCFQQKHYADAVECYSKSINSCPPEEGSKLAVYYQNRAAAHEKLMDWKSVVKDCSSAIELDRKYFKAVKRRSRAYEMLGQNRKALEDVYYIRETQRVDGVVTPEDGDHLKRILELLGKEEAPKYTVKKEAPQKYEMDDYMYMFNYDVFTIPTTSHKKDSNYCEIMENMKNGEYKTVLGLCEKEIVTRGKHAIRAKLLRGTIRQLMGDPRSLKDFDDIVKLSKMPDRLIFIDALLKSGHHEKKEGKYMDALEWLQCARNWDPENATIGFHNGLIFSKLGKYEEAMECFKKSCNLDPSFQAPRVTLAYFPSQLTEELSLALLKDFPRSAKAWGCYVYYLERCGRMEKAMASVEKAISLNPSDPYFGPATQSPGPIKSPR